jgi:radical SAM superfamily enzyme YgiQ (UPF0313 family)
MKIVLILPRGGIYRKKTGAFPIFIRYSPLTLPMLAALVPKELNATIETYDEGVEVIDKEKIKADFIAITSITGAAPRAYAYADYFRAKGIPVVIGGVHATLMPEEAAQHADAVVTGIAVDTWPQLLRDFKAGQMKKIYKVSDDISYANWPNPNREINKRKPFVSLNSLQATYGCSNRCEFCVTPYTCKDYKQRPIDDVINEIKKIKGKYIEFVDPSPIENVEYAKALYKALIPLKKKWVGCATTRIGRDDELLDLAAKSGCKGLLIGFESVNQNVLNNISKGFNRINKYFDLVNKLHKKHISIMGCFVFGLDTDGKDVFKNTVDFVNKANIDLPRFTVNTPFPGTRLFDRMNEGGRLTTKFWSMYDAQHVVIKPKNMTAQELQQGHHWAWKKTYKWTSIIKRLFFARSFTGVILLASYAYRHYALNLPKYDRETMSKDIEI